jgi:leader peptidase (prepilin peptidase)/N-methyltransferase
MIPLPFWYILVFLVGSVVGSFMNVCIYRLPRNQSIVFPSSSCPRCGSRILWYDNIPMFGFLLLGGKCRFCKESISFRYPVVEFITGLLALLLFFKFQFTATFFAMFLFSASLVVVTFIDLEHRIIPDEISLPGIVIGFILSFFIVNLYRPEEILGWKESLVGIVAGGGSLLLVAYGYQMVTRKEGMGGGDIKLLAMMGAFLGWRSIPFIIFLSSLAGSVVGISLMLARNKDSRLSIPFGPFLAFGALVFIFFGRQIIGWYLGLGGDPRG